MRQLSRKLSLLIVDDDPSIVRLLTEITRKNLSDKFDIVGMTDPQEASNWLQDNCCDVLLTDIQMPVLVGTDLLKIAKKRNAWTQVLFITGYSTMEWITGAIAAGAIDYLLKPIKPAEVVEVLNQQHARISRWLSAVHGTLSAARTGKSPAPAVSEAQANDLSAPVR